MNNGLQGKMSRLVGRLVPVVQVRDNEAGGSRSGKDRSWRLV